MNIKKTIFSNQEGVALIEIALFLPLILAILMGALEIGRYIIITQKLSRASYAMANITTQFLPAKKPSLDPANEISLDNLNNSVFPSFSRIMNPYSDRKAQRVIISSIQKTSGDLLIKWQATSKPTDGGLSNSQTISIVSSLPPAGINPSVKDTPAIFNPEIIGDLSTIEVGENLIVVEVFFHYQPLINNIASNFFPESTLVSRSYLMPRQGNLLTLPPQFE